MLKGPTSALYGGGLGSPLGGLINVVSEQPAENVEGLAAFRGGGYSTVDPYADVNVPPSSKIAARVAGEYLSNESWIDEVEGDRWSAQPTLLFQLAHRTRLLVQGQYNHRSQLEYSGLPATQALAGQLDRYAFPGATIDQSHTVINGRLATAELQHAFSDDLHLSVSSRYYSANNPEFGSFVDPAFYPPDPSTPTVYPVLALNMLTTTKEGTFDANLAANVQMLGGRHELLAGIDYDHINFFSAMGFAGVPVGEIDLAHPVYNVSFGPWTPFNLTQTDRYATGAGYLQDQATYGRLHLTGSVRFTQLEFREREQATDRTYHHVSPRAGATFDLAPGVAVYAGYATAFRAPLRVLWRRGTEA